MFYIVAIVYSHTISLGMFFYVSFYVFCKMFYKHKCFFVVAIVHSHSISLGMFFFAKCFTNINVFWLCPLYTATWCFLCFLFMFFAKYFTNINVLCCFHCTHCIIKRRIAKIEIVYVFMFPLYTATRSAFVCFLQNVLQL